MTDLRDSLGSPIIPSLVPPATEPPYPTATSSRTSAASLSQPPPPTPPEQAEIHPPRKSQTEPLNARPVRPSADLPVRTGGGHLMRTETAPSGVEMQAQLRRTRTDQPIAANSSSLVGGGKRPVFKRPSPELDRTTSYQFDDYSSDSNTSSDDEVDYTGNDTGEEHDRRSLKESKKKKKNASRRSSSDRYRQFSVGNDQYRTKGKVSQRDGRLKISVKEHVTTGYLAQTLSTGIKRRLKHERNNKETLTAVPEGTPESVVEAGRNDDRPIPKLNIVIMVIGSRGDIQPFIKIGKVLKEVHGHRVRIATHPTFRKFVEKDSGLEFFSVGGDPSELMAFMVKNPGLIPSVETVRQGEIGRRRAAMSDMFQGMWRACINATDDEADQANLKMMGDKRAFVADAIIANPPAFAHVHIAERLGIPLHIMFTFPYSPTTQFPHPLANIKNSNIDPNYTNFISYPLVDMMTWQGLGDLVNRFRKSTLGLDPVSKLWAPGQLYRLKVPHTYMWSPGLVPKPPDWGPEIDIAGFVFLELASSFKPAQELTDFIKAGPPPVYIGFGSIVVDDPEAFTNMIFEAVKMAGVRALVSKGWGGIGGDDDAPENVFMLGNTPHDWLFPQVSAVVHHGGAGTTAMGLKCGKPTMIVPFFGDQPFWGAMVSSAKAGAHECIPFKKLTTELLAEGIKQCLTDEAKENAQKIAVSIEKEGDSAKNAVDAFHRHLPLQGPRAIRCSLLEERVATWHMKGTKLRLSSVAIDILVDRKKIKWNQLRLIRHVDWNDFDGPGEPLTGGGSAVLRTVATATKGVGMIPVKMVQSIKKRDDHHRKKKRIKRRQQEKLEKFNTANGNEPTFDKNKPLNAQPGRPSLESDPMLNRKRPSAPQRGDTTISKLSADPEENIAEELGSDALQGFSKTGRAIVRAPMDLSLAVAQGFHNAPRLYGDATVRRPTRVSGFKSGLLAGRNEFVYGVHDAFTGLYTQPRDGLKREGTLGLVKGAGMGIGGLFLKNVAAGMGPGVYFMKGIDMEFRKAKQPTSYIRRARILEGRDLIEKMNKDEEEAVVESVLRGWEVVSEVIMREEKRVEDERNARLGHLKKVLDKTHLNFAKMGEHHKEARRTGKLEHVQLAEKTLQAKRKGMSLKEWEKYRNEKWEAMRQGRKSKDLGKRSKESDKLDGALVSDTKENAPPAPAPLSPKTKATNGAAKLAVRDDYSKMRSNTEVADFAVVNGTVRSLG